VYGNSTVYFILNEKPRGGNCTIDKTAVLAAAETVTVTCLGWISDDGVIANFELFGKSWIK
jgi:hypothetical protein